MARWKRRAAGTTRYLTDIDLRTSIDSDDLIERVAVRAMEKDLVSHDTPHAELYLQACDIQRTTGTVDPQYQLIVIAAIMLRASLSNAATSSGIRHRLTAEIPQSASFSGVS